MDEYINNYDKYTAKIVYQFNVGYGGIGDCIKFFMYVLHLCMKHKYQLYYQINHIPLENYIRLRYPQMYIARENVLHPRMFNLSAIDQLDAQYYIVSPDMLYGCYDINALTVPIADVFDFSDSVKENRNVLLNHSGSYIVIHLRLGDKYLETDPAFVMCKEDARVYHEDRLYHCIEDQNDNTIVFFCDNNSYKQKIKEKYPNVIITHSQIGHTSLSNTTDKQVLDTITEFYIMTESDKIYAASTSGFSTIAAKWRGTLFVDLV